MISPEYKAILQETHEQNPEWGTSAHVWMPYINKHLGDAKTILDYGCGKGELKNHTDLTVYEYDPAFDIDERQEVDFLVCVDVLEHVEDKYIRDVLDDMSQYADHFFIAIHLNEAQNTLSDGRNAHINIKTAEQWSNLLSEHFEGSFQKKGINHLIAYG